MDIVLTSYFTGNPDPQRGHRWVENLNDLKDLAESCAKFNKKLVVLHDCFIDMEYMGAELVKVKPPYNNPYFSRWRAQYDYLIQQTNIERVWMVDATDVTMLYDPFYSMKPGVIYVGDEFDTVGNTWMRANATSPVIEKWIDDNADTLLLNCGVVGSDYIRAMAVCLHIDSAYKVHRHEGKIPKVEMPIFNYVMRTVCNHLIVHGRQVTTIFKSYETKSGAWWKHK